MNTQANESLMMNKTMPAFLVQHPVSTAYELGRTDANVTNEEPKVTEAVILLEHSAKTFGLISLLLNVLFLIAMQLLEDRSSVTNRLMRHMSIADLLASASFLITHTWPLGLVGTIIEDGQLTLKGVVPYAVYSLPWVFFSVYIFTLLVLTANHYVAVCKPWCYSRIFTGRFISCCMVIIWSVSSIQVSLPLAVFLVLCSFSNNDYALHVLTKFSRLEMTLWLTMFLAGTSVNIVLHGCVYLKIHRLRVRTRQRVDGNVGTHNVRSKHDAFVTVSLLLLASIFSRLPFPVLALVPWSRETWSHATAVTVLLLYMTFVTDPIIYLLRVKELRTSYAKMSAALRCRSCPLIRLTSARNSHTHSLYGHESMQMTSFDTSIRQSVFSKQQELI